MLIRLARKLAWTGGAGALLAGLPLVAAVAGGMPGSGGGAAAAPPSLLAGVTARTPADAWAVGAYCAPGCGPAASPGHALIEHWNGKAWSRIPGPGKPVFSSLSSVAAVSARDAWAVGGYCPESCRTASVSRTLILRWNGKTWSKVPSQDPGPGPDGIQDSLAGVSAVSARDAWAVGSGNGTLAEHWNGRTWSKVPSPSPDGPNALLAGVSAVSARDALAVGWITTPAAKLVPLAERWNGKTWSMVPSPSPGATDRILTGVSAVSATSAWAVGTTFGTARETTLIEHWNGRAWSLVPSPSPGVGGRLISVSAVSATSAWAVGSYCASACLSLPDGRTLIEHWNGRTWSVVPSPNPGPGGADVLSAVTATSAGNAWAAGQFCVPPGEIGCTGPGGFSHAVILHWNGKTWSSIASPAVQGPRLP